MSITDLAAILGGIAAIAGFGFGIWEFRRKTDLEIFRTYSEKYKKSLPQTFTTGGTSLANLTSRKIGKG